MLYVLIVYYNLALGEPKPYLVPEPMLAFQSSEECYKAGKWNIDHGFIRVDDHEQFRCKAVTLVDHPLPEEGVK